MLERKQQDLIYDVQQFVPENVRQAVGIILRANRPIIPAGEMSCATYSNATIFDLLPGVTQSGDQIDHLFHHIGI
jgi:hypothetical protein